MAGATPASAGGAQGDASAGARCRNYTPEAVMEERDRLEISAADYGALVGVSAITIYNWEKGESKSQAAQLEKWLAVKGIGKRKA